MYTRQYDVRWAGQVLRHRRVLREFDGKRNEPWERMRK